MADSNVELHQKGHEAFSRGDMGYLTQIIADDTLWHVPGKGPLSGDYKGRDAVFGFFAKLAELSEGTLKLEDHAFLGEDGEHTVALSRITASRSGKNLDVRLCEVVHWRNGQVAEDWQSFDDLYAVDEFWS